LELLHRDQWQVKLSKCVFAQRQLKYLGHVISEQGVATDPEKVQTVSHWPAPTSVKDLRSFLGLAGYNRRFVKHFGIITRPLNDLLKKGVIFSWTSVHDQAFQSLKNALISAPVLALPDFTKPFCVETDASGSDIGAVLTQAGHPLAYLSKSLSSRSQGLSTYEKEHLAILLALDHWRCYLQHAEFTILTNHKSLAQLIEQCLHTLGSKKFSPSWWGSNIRSFIVKVLTIVLLMLFLGYHLLSVSQYLLLSHSGFLRWSTRMLLTVMFKSS
jgi:hypothetical protein